MLTICWPNSWQLFYWIPSQFFFSFFGAPFSFFGARLQFVCGCLGKYQCSYRTFCIIKKEMDSNISWLSRQWTVILVDDPDVQLFHVLRIECRIQTCTYDFKYTSVECSFKALICMCVFWFIFMNSPKHVKPS